jgi:hypothetical protein
MEDVLTLYEKPLSKEEPVLCVDEKSVSLHWEVRAPMVMEPGRVHLTLPWSTPPILAKRP